MTKEEALSTILKYDNNPYTAYHAGLCTFRKFNKAWSLLNNYDEWFIRYDPKGEFIFELLNNHPENCYD